MMRILFGVILASTAVGSILLGGVVIAIMMALGCCLCGREFIGLAEAKGYKPSRRIVMFMIIAFFFLAMMPALPQVVKNWTGIHMTANDALAQFPILLTLGICLSFFRLLFRSEHPPATIADIASTIMGFIYVGWLPAHLTLLRSLMPSSLGNVHIANPLHQPGLAYVWVSLFIIWATDVFAYYVGKKWGKHKLFPEISPKKTVEGAIGGLVASAVIATMVVYAADNWLFASHPFQFKLWQAPLMGIVVSIASQLGDLCESLMKRDAGLKDSSQAIPGHGGFLDRGDSLMFGSPVSFYWIKIVVLGLY